MSARVPGPDSLDRQETVQRDGAKPDSLDVQKTVPPEATVPPAAERGLVPGTMLGQYRVVRLLGRGGMGEVYEVEHRVLRRQFALKLLPAEFASRDGALERFEREAQVMAQLEHPNIIRVDDFGETAGRWWLRLELANGVTSAGAVRVSLDDYAVAHGGRVEQGLLVGILRHIAEGLAYAHGRGVIHRDLKPGNILFVTDAAGEATAKISDFGLVKLVGEEWLRRQAELAWRQSLSVGEEVTRPHPKARAEPLTAPRAQVGTWDFMSPEQKRGEEVDGRTDIYALGVMTYRLLTGRGVGVKLPSRIDPSLMPAWDGLVTETLEELREERLADCQAFLDRLVEVEGQLAGRSAPEAVPAEEAPADEGADAVQAPPGRARLGVSTPERRKPTSRRAAEHRLLQRLVDRALSRDLGRRKGDERERKALTAPHESARVFAAVPDHRLLPADLVAVSGAKLATLNGLAAGSAEAQAAQKALCAQLGVPVEVKTKKTGIVFRLVPAGSFTMGSPKSEQDAMVAAGLTREWVEGEKQHPVTLTRPFWCGRYEVTQGQWEQVMGTNPSRFTGAGKDAPVEQVSWEECQEFVKQLCQAEGVAAGTYRLLTEAEWEYACRAGTETALYTGELRVLGKKNAPALDPIAWYGGNSGADYAGGVDSSRWPEKQRNHCSAGTHLVGGKLANAHGLQDMVGNVWEWCSDWYGEYPSGAVTDPSGPGAGSDRVFRGGGWIDGAGDCRAARRGWFEPGIRLGRLGLRLARIVNLP